MTNKEISTALKIPPSTCYRILSSLKKYDYIYRRRPDMRYFLGYAHLRFAESVLEGMDVATICLPYLEDLHGQTDETTFFADFNGKSCVAMEICGHINTRVAVGRGEVMPLHCSAAGKAVLAFLPGKEKKNILKSLDYTAYTKNTITGQEELEKNLEEICRSGVSYNFQEFHKGISALATPIFGRQNRVQGAIVVVGTSVDLDRSQLEEYSSLFLRASADITAAMGGEFPPWLIEHLNAQEEKKDEQ